MQSWASSRFTSGFCSCVVVKNEFTDLMHISFFFSSRRRHTRCSRDWSSDVCSSDLVNMKFVEGAKIYAGQKAYSKQEAMDLFRKAASVASKPFIYLSAGVSNAEFTESLELAAEAKVKFNGVLCGRATWKDGIPIYGKQGAEAFRKRLQTEGVKKINKLNDRLKAASSWHPIYEAEPALASA